MQQKLRSCQCFLHYKTTNMYVLELQTTVTYKQLVIIILDIKDVKDLTLWEGSCQRCYWESEFCEMVWSCGNTEQNCTFDAVLKLHVPLRAHWSRNAGPVKQEFLTELVSNLRSIMTSWQTNIAYLSDPILNYPVLWKHCEIRPAVENKTTNIKCKYIPLWMFTTQQTLMVVNMYVWLNH